MNYLHFKKGLHLNMTGQPLGPVEVLPGSQESLLDKIGVVPARIAHIKPKLHVRTGDHVNLGSLLFTDKRNPDIRFLSPGSGEIEAVEFGPRRIIEAIVIRLDKEETLEKFEAVDQKQLAAMIREDLVRHLLTGGMWPLLRSLPFRDIADPEFVPPAIIVNLDNLAPFHPTPALYLNSAEESFYLGLQALRKLSKVVQVTSCSGNSLPKEIQKLISHAIRGPYPAHDPGVFLYHTRTSADQNQSWFISGQDVQDLGRFLRSGVYPTERCLAVSSPARAGYVRTRLGVPVSRLLPKTTSEFTDVGNLQILAGGVWKGQAAGLESYIGMYEASLVALPKGGQPEFFGFARAGWKKPSQSRAFFSFLNHHPLNINTGQHGEERACINCGSCAKVCPVDILPQFTLKSILAGEVEEALAHGLLDCVECGLCSYVCPAKIELSHQLKLARSDYYREKTG